MNLKSGLKHILLLPINRQNEMSFIGTTDINDGFQPGDKKAGESLSPFPRKSSGGMTDVSPSFAIIKLKYC